MFYILFDTLFYINNIYLGMDRYDHNNRLSMQNNSNQVSSWKCWIIVANCTIGWVLSTIYAIISILYIIFIFRMYYIYNYGSIIKALLTWTLIKISTPIYSEWCGEVTGCTFSRLLWACNTRIMTCKKLLHLLR